MSTILSSRGMIRYRPARVVVEGQWGHTRARHARARHVQRYRSCAGPSAPANLHTNPTQPQQRRLVKTARTTPRWCLEAAAPTCEAKHEPSRLACLHPGASCLRGVAVAVIDDADARGREPRRIASQRAHPPLVGLVQTADQHPLPVRPEGEQVGALLPRQRTEGHGLSARCVQSPCVAHTLPSCLRKCFSVATQCCCPRRRMSRW